MDNIQKIVIAIALSTILALPIAQAGTNSSGGGNLGRLAPRKLKIRKNADRAAQEKIERYLLQPGNDPETQDSLTADLVKLVTQQMSSETLSVAAREFSHNLEMGDPTYANGLKNLFINNKEALLEDISHPSYVLSTTPLFVEKQKEQKDAMTAHQVGATVYFDASHLAKYEVTFAEMRPLLVLLALHEHTRHFGVHDEDHRFGKAGTFQADKMDFFDKNSDSMYVDQLVQAIYLTCLQLPCIPVPQAGFSDLSFADLSFADLGFAGTDAESQSHLKAFNLLLSQNLKRAHIYITFEQATFAAFTPVTTVKQAAVILGNNQSYDQYPTNYRPPRRIDIPILNGLREIKESIAPALGLRR